MIQITSNNYSYITGKGDVFWINRSDFNLNENDLIVGDIILINNTQYRIRGVEGYNCLVFIMFKTVVDI